MVFLTAERGDTGEVNTRPQPRRRVLATSPFTRPTVVPATTEGFNVGDRVTFDPCGVGKVVGVTATHLTVDFGELGIRRIEAGTAGLSAL
jgi:hypothetical protein